jgi:hypothetical protein
MYTSFFCAGTLIHHHQGVHLEVDLGHGHLQEGLIIFLVFLFQQSVSICSLKLNLSYLC